MDQFAQAVYSRLYLRGQNNSAGERRYTNLTMSRIIFQRPRIVHAASRGGVHECHEVGQSHSEECRRL